MATRSTTQLMVGDDGVAIITINNPPLNLLSGQVMLSLKGSIEEALACNEVKAIVVNGARGKFSGGFDVTAFGNTQMVKKKKDVGVFSIELVTDLLEGARKPLVAAIDGPAFGGGLEIALACHARVSTPTSQLGLTELQYGIIPGFGGTQRLPRLVGLPKALDMILMSKRINGKDAFSMSLVDALASADDLIRTASCWALDIYEHRKPWILSLHRTDRLEPLREARLILNKARAHARKRNPNLVHPLICIDVIEEGIVNGGRSALLKEAEALNELRQSETCKSLVHFFFARYNTSKIPGITDVGLQPRKVNKVAVIGGGSAGSRIATEFILGNFHVILKECHENSLVAAIGEIKADLQSLVLAGKVTKEKFEDAVSLLKGVVEYDSFIDVDLVVEATEGSIDLKQQIFTRLEHYCPQHCILASNISTFDLKLIGERTKSQARIVGAHFCSPPLVEIVQTEHTSPQVTVDLLNVVKKMKKTPLVVRNSPGLVVHRICVMYSHAAMFLAQRSEEKDHLGQVMQKFGMGISPFRMMNDIQSVSKTACKTMPENKQDGNSTWNDCTKAKNSPNDSKVSIMVSLHLGYFSPDCKNVGLLAKWNHTLLNEMDHVLECNVEKLSEEDIIQLILFPVVNEAARIMEEGIVIKASDIDIASVLATGFPSYRGGIIHWANTLGSKYICSRLETWSIEYGEFYKPCAYLIKHSSLGTPITQIKSQI